MKIKSADQLLHGDHIETPGGMFRVAQSVWGFGGTVVLRGTVAGVMSAWASYPEWQEFTVVTLH